MKISEMVRTVLEADDEEPKEKKPNFLSKSISAIKTHKTRAGLVGSGLGLAALGNYHPKTAGAIGLTAGGLGYLHHRYLNKKAKKENNDKATEPDKATKGIDDWVARNTKNATV